MYAYRTDKMNDPSALVLSDAQEYDKIGKKKSGSRCLLSGHGYPDQLIEPGINRIVGNGFILPSHPF